MTLALWCVLIAGLLPYIATGIAKAGDRTFDNDDPRAWLAAQSGYRARANAAQANSFEAFPLFAAAVIIAHMVRGPQAMADVLAVVFIGARLTYVALYVAGRGALRSLAWLVGLASVVGIFVAAAL